MTSPFENAWKLREKNGLLSELHTSALRLFYGPGEAKPQTPWSFWAVDGYGEFLWVTEWEGARQSMELAEVREATKSFFAQRGYRGAVILRRPKQGVPEMPQALWGDLPPESFVVTEVLSREPRRPISLEIRLLEGRHPGLFLDHRPLREWLASSGAVRGASVLNTFAYTGSLSVAAWAGGAARVTTLDLSKPTIRWAERNARLNDLPEGQSTFIAGDFFEELPRLRRKGERFDVVISDPPSFSRGKKGNFSTQKDLVKLHELLLSVLKPGGVLVTSINSANVSWDKYEAEVREAWSLASAPEALQLLHRIEQPVSFPSHSGDPKSRYLKGFVFQLST